jgi:hypothetical protein
MGFNWVFKGLNQSKLTSSRSQAESDNTSRRIAQIWHNTSVMNTELFQRHELIFRSWRKRFVIRIQGPTRYPLCFSVIHAHTIILHHKDVNFKTRSLREILWAHLNIISRRRTGLCYSCPPVNAFRRTRLRDTERKVCQRVARVYCDVHLVKSVVPLKH